MNDLKEEIVQVRGMCQGTWLWDTDVVRREGTVL